VARVASWDSWRFSAPLRSAATSSAPVSAPEGWARRLRSSRGVQLRDGDRASRLRVLPDHVSCRLLTGNSAWRTATAREHDAPTGIRTRAATLKGWCPSPLVDGGRAPSLETAGSGGASARERARQRSRPARVTLPLPSDKEAPMRIASFNVESLFDRAKALSLPTWANGRKILEDYATVNKLLNEPFYTAAITDQIVALLVDLRLKNEDQPRGGFAPLRQNRGHLLKRTKVNGETTPVIVANGREDWIGWVELTKEPTDELATEHTAMVMRDIDADVLGVVEADNRTALELFSEILLKKVNGKPYEHVMLIDGNDDRGIDVGILLRKGFDLASVRSHVDDLWKGSRIFSRDCPEYTVVTKTGQRL